MKAKTAFSKKDLIVVLCCIFFLLANLAAITGTARRRAREAVCLSNLRQWGVIFEMYANEYDGKNVAGFYTDPADGEFYESMWIVLLHPYYQTFDICMCPATPRTWRDGIFTGPFVGWDFRWLESYAEGEFYDYYGPPTLPGYAYGSYGKNSMCSSEMTEEVFSDEPPINFPTVYVKDADNIPLFADCMFMGALFLSPTDDIPPYSDRWFMEPGVEGEMHRFCIDRHRDAVNILFLDFSVRKVGLKQLWQLKWHADWEQESEENPPPDPYDPDVWPEWMKDFKTY
jgi:prepilin-type processing-associated H-X9-DG protein